VVEEYLRSIEDRVTSPLADAGEQTPRERLVAVFQGPARGGPLRGCPFHNAAVEAAGSMPGVQEIVRTSKRSFIDGLAELANQAGAADPQLLGNELSVLYEGAAALATSLEDLSPWTHARAAAETLIDQALAR
jgi:hypothetical protein